MKRQVKKQTRQTTLSASSRFSVVLLGWVVPIGISLGQQPEWIVRGTDARYPQQLYFVGVGEGNSAKEAAADAKRALAEVFQVQVVSKLEQQQSSSLTENTKGHLEANDSSTANSSTELKTDTVLQGASIADGYYQESEKTYYALAILNRIQLGTQLRAHWQEGVDFLKGEYPKSLENPRLRTLNQLEKKVTELQNLRKELGIVLPAQALLPGAALVEKVATALPTLMNKLKESQQWTLKFASETPQGVRSRLRQCLSEAHFGIAADQRPSQTSSGTILVSSKTQHLVAPPGWARLSLRVDVKIVRLKLGQSACFAEGVGAAVTEDAARGKAEEALTSELCSKTTQILLQD